MQTPIFRGYITKKNAKSYDLTFNIWCTSRTHIRTFLRFYGFPESDRFCTFLIIKGNKYLIIVEIDGIDEELKETEVGITNMLNAIQMGILTSSTKERLEALEDQRKELQARIAEERLAKPKMKEEFVRFWLLRFRKLDMTQPEQRQALVDTFINAIYLYDDKVLITFNYKEGTETVAFGEAVKAEKSSDMSARGAPNFERQIERFGVLFLCRKAAAHFLHTVCTFARIRGFSAQGLHSLLSFA